MSCKVTSESNKKFTLQRDTGTGLMTLGGQADAGFVVAGDVTRRLEELFLLLARHSYSALTVERVPATNTFTHVIVGAASMATCVINLSTGLHVSQATPTGFLMSTAVYDAAASFAALMLGFGYKKVEFTTP